MTDRIDPHENRQQTLQDIYDIEMVEGTPAPVGIQPEKYKVISQYKGYSLEEGDFFLLRRGDALAVATLRSYAANAMTILDLDAMGILNLDPHMQKHLSALADDVSNMADAWERDTDMKLPD